jgi:hypothetical protein
VPAHERAAGLDRLVDDQLRKPSHYGFHPVIVEAYDVAKRECCAPDNSRPFDKTSPCASPRGSIGSNHTSAAGTNDDNVKLVNCQSDKIPQDTVVGN